MKRNISLLMAALMLVTLLAGCGAKSGGGENDSGVRAVTLRNTAFMTTSDPFATTNTHDYTVHENIYEGLYDLNEANGGYDLRLAEKIDANDDATEYIVTLRQDVKFHNGETMTADDVVFSYGLAQASAKMGSYVRPLDHVEKIDDYTVKIVMNQSFSPIGHMLHKVKILSQKEVTEQGDNFGKVANKAGTGPYMWDENNYNPMTSWSAVAFDDYYRGKAQIEKITWNVIEDDTSAITALQNGEVDYMVVPISYWEDIKSSDKFTCVEKQSNEVMTFCINIESEKYGELFRDDKVRLAMMYALDRDGINKLVCDGYGAPTYMYINPNYADDEDPLSLKSDFILSLCELIVGGRSGLAPVEKTVIDRCVRTIYRPYLADPAPERMPILQDLYDELLKQSEPEARRVASALELYCTGSLNLFNHRTNVQVNSRLLCFDIKALGKMLKKIGLLILTDQIWGRVTENRDRRRATWVYQDEFHVLLAEPQTAAYSVEIFRRFRKWGAIPSGITQNVKSLLESSEIESIFGNCDFLYMLSQAAGDQKVLASHLGISPHQLSYVTHSGSGEGLLFYGDTTIPFVDHFPQDTELYTLLTTKPEDKANG